MLTADQQPIEAPPVTPVTPNEVSPPDSSNTFVEGALGALRDLGFRRDSATEEQAAGEAPAKVDDADNVSTPDRSVDGYVEVVARGGANAEDSPAGPPDFAPTAVLVVSPAGATDTVKDDRAQTAGARRHE